MRESGILLPVASLPSDYGIGCFSKEAYEFVDRLYEAGQSYWQILPLGPTGYGDSPYQSFSTFAGNPYFIDLTELEELGYLSKEDCRLAKSEGHDRYIDYEQIYLTRFKILKKAYKNSGIAKDPAFQSFIKENDSWLLDYALYMAIKDSQGGISFGEWEEPIKTRKSKALAAAREEYADEIGFYQFQQYLFYSQWERLKSYANQKGIRIIGDIPIYVAFDSSDAWANPELFQFDEDSVPTEVAGCPPDAFTADGQLWGNPLYDWEYHKQTGYQWWIKRMAHSYRLYDVVRIDHFRGFDEYYAIPYGAETAVAGRWKKGPGLDFFKVMKSELGTKDIIAEDLGFLTPAVYQLVEESGYPGMKVLQFAFDSREESDYLPHNYNKNCVVYTGTHDNDTICGWYKSLNKRDKAFCREYLNIGRRNSRDIHWVFIRAALSSTANLAVIPIQDYLGLSSEARINTPSTLGENWKWRLKKEEFTGELAEKIRRMTSLYKRCRNGIDND